MTQNIADSEDIKLKTGLLMKQGQLLHVIHENQCMFGEKKQLIIQFHALITICPTLNLERQENEDYGQKVCEDSKGEEFRLKKAYQKMHQCKLPAVVMR